jgi:hypothetical protein
MRRVVGLLALLVLLSGCGSGGFTVGEGPGGRPQCAARPSGADGSAVLMAQAVPTATLIPCLHALPEGWNYEALTASNGKATFWLTSDRDGTRAATISLRPRCTVTGATEVPSERSGTRRYELVSRVTPGYRGDRIYTFEGGCITYHFDLHGKTRGVPLASVTQALGFISRDTLRRQVREDSDNRLSLDPPVKRASQAKRVRATLRSPR